jgi:hypothetical protein
MRVRWVLEFAIVASWIPGRMDVPVKKTTGRQSMRRSTQPLTKRNKAIN